MIFGTATERPAKLVFLFGNWMFVDTCEAQSHQPRGVELPVLVAIGAEPLATIVVVFVSKAHGDAIASEGPEFLDQPVVEFAPPFAGQERLNLGATAWKLSAIAPAAVESIGKRDARRVARIPCVLCRTDLLNGALFGEWGKRRKADDRRASAIASVSIMTKAAPVATMAADSERGATFSLLNIVKLLRWIESAGPSTSLSALERVSSVAFLISTLLMTRDRMRCS